MFVLAISDNRLVTVGRLCSHHGVIRLIITPWFTQCCAEP